MAAVFHKNHIFGHNFAILGSFCVKLVSIPMFLGSEISFLQLKILFIIELLIKLTFLLFLTLIPSHPPLDGSHDKSTKPHATAAVYWLFTFKSHATFETKFVAPAYTVLEPRPFKKFSSTPKLLKNVISCIKSMQIGFLP